MVPYIRQCCPLKGEKEPFGSSCLGGREKKREEEEEEEEKGNMKIGPIKMLWRNLFIAQLFHSV